MCAESISATAGKVDSSVESFSATAGKVDTAVESFSAAAGWFSTLFFTQNGFMNIEGLKKV